MDRKGAIELTANFIIVIVISSIILVGGLALFYNLRDDITDYKDTIDSQTEDRVKSMMLNNGARVAVYPHELEVSPGDGQPVGLGITNILNADKTFNIAITIKHYASSTAEPTPVTPLADEYYFISSSSIPVAPGNQEVKSILIRIPKGADKGQYIYTIKVVDSADPSVNYDAVQVAVKV
jgi:uncharacterized membrane protein